MLCFLFLLGSCLVRAVRARRRARRQPASRRPAASSRRATVPSMTSSPTRTTRPPSTAGSTVDLQGDRPAVEPAERRGQPLLLLVGQRRRRWSRAATDCPRRRPASSASRSIAFSALRDARAGQRRCRTSRTVTGLTLPDEQPVQQRGLALGAAACGRRATRPSSRSPATIRPKRNSSSSTSSSSPARSAAPAPPRAERSSAVDQVAAAATSGRDQRRRASVQRPRRRPCRRSSRRTSAGRGPRPAGPGRTAPGAARARGRAARPRRTARRPGQQRVGRGRGCASAAGLRARALVAATPRRTTPGWTACISGRPPAGAVMPSSSARNRSTVPLRRASSASDSPTILPARSTASVPISAAQLADDCCRCGGQLLLAAGDDAVDSSCAWAAQLLDDLLALGAGLVADLRGLGAGLGELGPVLLERRLPRPAPPRPARCRPRSPRGAPRRSSPCAGRRTSSARSRRSRRRSGR